ncbi:MAG: pyridoxal 5'-phosphate synthase glutaminase subunit PdxT [Nitrososphaerota archaeon]|nr:pyridoxal 5'-phosphate synthase glutaminase subunit PdxT [Nitrososphaerota archaeon]
MTLKVGILGIQGDLEEHVSAAKKAIEDERLKGDLLIVKTPHDVEAVDGIIIPGGESTTMGVLASTNGTLSKLSKRLSEGLPALGTCAGLILLAKRSQDRVVGPTDQPLTGSLDIEISRNAFGRQRESFEAQLSVPKLGNEPFRGIFIRAPLITSVGRKVDVLSRIQEGVVAVQQGNIIGTCFHPELSGDTRLHRYFLSLITRDA